MLSSVIGCAGSQASGRAPASDTDVSDLRAQMLRERRERRDLENEVSLLRARLRDTPPATALPPTAPRAQPAPEQPADAMAEASGATAVDQPLPETLGDALLGEVEIVYEGEAAEDVTVRPQLKLHESSRSYAGREPVEPPAQATPGGVVATGGGDRLPVTRGEIPTVQAQLRRARAAQPAPRLGARPSPPAGPTAAPAPAPSADPSAEYRRLVDALRAGNHEYAAAGLRAFLDLHPRHDLADNAQYWLGEAYYDRKRYALAQVEFQKVIDRHRRGNKVPDALLKVGFCQLQQGQRVAARATLRKVITTYPGTSPAGLARARLQELDSHE